MRVVVMDEDMREPITVVEVPWRLMHEIQFEGRAPYINLPALANFDVMPRLALARATEEVSFRVVRLKMEPIYRGTSILHWAAVPDNPELALLLRAAFLPGQVNEVRRREALAWFQGAMAVIDH